jgi:hypothetical protein
MYLLRTNLTETKPDVIWERYVLLTQVEAAFKSLTEHHTGKVDFRKRPISWSCARPLSIEQIENKKNAKNNKKSTKP